MIGRFEIENANASGARLPESDAADMDIFLIRVEQLLPILGHDFLKPHAANVSKEDSTEILFCDIKGLRAIGRVSSDGFIVYKGSFAVLDERNSTKKYPHPANVRKKLVAEGVLIKSGDGLEFVQDYEFSSPSAAASVIHGGHANGLTAWKDKEGATLREKEAKEIE